MSSSLSTRVLIDHGKHHFEDDIIIMIILKTRTNLQVRLRFAVGRHKSLIMQHQLTSKTCVVQSESWSLHAWPNDSDSHRRQPQKIHYCGRRICVWPCRRGHATVIRFFRFVDAIGIVVVLAARFQNSGSSSRKRAFVDGATLIVLQ